MNQTSKHLTVNFFFCTVVSKEQHLILHSGLQCLSECFYCCLYERYDSDINIVFCMMEFALVKFTKFISVFSLSLIEACVYLTQGNV